MQTISEKKAARTRGGSGWPTRIVGLTRILGGILFLAPSQALTVALPGTYNASLTWGASLSNEVIGYRVYYGIASGHYSNSVVAGNVTTNTVSGLASGVTYFFAVTAYNADGLESPFSNEISFVPGPSLRIRVASNRQVILTVKGLVDHNYEILATQDFKTWTVIGTAMVGAGGSLDFTDTNAPTFSKRFYGTRDVQP